MLSRSILALSAAALALLQALGMTKYRDPGDGPVMATLPTFKPAPPARARVGPNLPLGKCINLGSMLDKPIEGSHGQRKLLDTDLLKIKNAGFNTVRIPVNFSAHTTTTKPYLISQAFMARLRHVLKVSKDNNLNAIVDMHRYEEMNTDPFNNVDRFTSIWRQAASQLSDQPSSVWFEILNEPKNKINDGNFLEIISPAISAIRETNPKRIVIVGGPMSSRVTRLDSFNLPNDPYVVQTFHNYDPIPFTHQGVSKVVPEWVKNRRFGSQHDIRQLQENLRIVKAYMQKSGRVPFLGEFGVMGIDTISDNDRIRYLRTTSSAYASIGVQSCVWNYANSFNLNLNNGNWRAGVVSAIVGTN